MHRYTKAPSPGSSWLSRTCSSGRAESECLLEMFFCQEIITMPTYLSVCGPCVHIRYVCRKEVLWKSIFLSLKWHRSLLRKFHKTKFTCNSEEGKLKISFLLNFPNANLWKNAFSSPCLPDSPEWVFAPGLNSGPAGTRWTLPQRDRRKCKVHRLKKKGKLLLF